MYLRLGSILMVETVKNATNNGNVPNEYAKLYFAEKPKEPEPVLGSVFEEVFFENKFFLQPQKSEESQKFFESKRTLVQKIGAGMEGFFMSFISLSALITFGAGFLFNKIPEHIFTKSLKPLAVGLYVMSFLFAALAYNTGNRYNKKLGTLSNLYSMSDKEAQNKADKAIKELYNANKNNVGFEIIKNADANDKMDKLIGDLNKHLAKNALSKTESK